VSETGIDTQSADFDLRALYDALDARRVVRQLTWRLWPENYEVLRRAC